MKKFSELQEEYQNFYVPIFKIEVEGDDLLEKSVEVFGVTVNNTLEGADDVFFTVNNPFNPDEKDNFLYLKKGGLFDIQKIVKNVTVKLGYGDRTSPKTLKTVFEVIITAVDVSFPANGISQLTIKGFDHSHRMMKTKRSDNYGSSDKPIKYSDIVKKIISNPKLKYNLKPEDVRDTLEPHRQLKQDRQSDYEFIKTKLADKLGFEVFVVGKDFYFRPPANDKSEVITTLEWGTSLISFSPEVDTNKQITEVLVRSWDSDKQKPIIGKAKRGDEHGRDRKGESGGQQVEDTQGQVVQQYWKAGFTQKQADDFAKSVLNRLSNEFVKGSGECIGIPDVLPGKNIGLAGLGSRFSKPYYIERTTHSISTSGYKTTFNIKENTI
jgi:phage protein D